MDISKLLNPAPPSVSEHDEVSSPDDQQAPVDDEIFGECDGTFSDLEGDSKDPDETEDEGIGEAEEETAEGQPGNEEPSEVEEDEEEEDEEDDELEKERAKAVREEHSTMPWSLYTVFCNRSDGLLEVPVKKNGKTVMVPNRPTDEQLDPTPNAKGEVDYYRLLGQHDEKTIDWRLKLGTLAGRQIGPDHLKEETQILYELPLNFRLYEHIKTVAPSAGTSKSSQGRSGDSDRHDAYLYGHFGGPQKRYRSPAEFYNHLEWLIKQESDDPRHCRCKCCSPQGSHRNWLRLMAERDAQREQEAAEAATTESRKRKQGLQAPRGEEDEPESVAGPARPTAAPTSSSAAASTSRASVVPAPTAAAAGPSVTPRAQRTTGPPPSKASSTGGVVRRELVPSSTARAAPSATAGTPSSAFSAASAIRSTPLPPTRCDRQANDARYGYFLFRAGELVWFQRSAGGWGIGLVQRRLTFDDEMTSVQAYYVVQPLSHPYDPLPQVTHPETLLRPWLAWTPPVPTFEALVGQTFDTADWMAVIQGRLGPGNILVDAPVLAATAIGATYTLFYPLPPPVRAAADETYWNGIFLGGEKIWVGEPVRLGLGRGGALAVMVVHHIVERGGPTNAAGRGSLVDMIGDIYVPADLDATGHDPNLPDRVRRDIEWRNERAARNSIRPMTWELVLPMRRLGLAEIKGRWYECSLLLPLLTERKDAQDAMATGNVMDMNPWLNVWGDKLPRVAGEPVGTKTATRTAALGTKVPPGTVFEMGFHGLDEGPLRIYEGVGANAGPGVRASGMGHGTASGNGTGIATGTGAGTGTGTVGSAPATTLTNSEVVVLSSDASQSNGNSSVVGLDDDDDDQDNMERFMDLEGGDDGGSMQ